MWISAFSIDDGLGEDLGDFVVMGVERFNCGACVETKQIDLVVHSCNGEGPLRHERATCSDSALAHEETLLGLEVCSRMHLDEPIYRRRHAHRLRLVLIPFHLEVH